MITCNCVHDKNPAACAGIECDAPEAATKRNIRMFWRFLVILALFSGLYSYGRACTARHHLIAGSGTVMDSLWDDPKPAPAREILYYGANKPAPAETQRLAKIYREAR